MPVLSPTLHDPQGMARLPKLRNRIKALNWRRGVVFGVLLLLLVVTGYKALQIWGLVHSLQVRIDRLQSVVDDNADLELREVGETLRGAHSDLDALRSEVAFLMPFTSYLGWLPRIGADLQAAPALLDVALTVTEAGAIAFDGLEPLVALIDAGDAEGQLLSQVLQVLSDARPDLEAAQTRLGTAMEYRAEIDGSALSARTANLVAQLDRYVPLMQSGLDTGRLLPDLLGTSGPRTFLVLAQNNDELRATGGFISAMGLLTLDGGEMGDIAFEDSYAVDDFTHPYPDSPPPFLRYMGIDQWVFRDANWSPDFPTSAQKAIELYQISRDLEVDGVVAVDQRALEAIVNALAPLDVEGWPERVTGENVTSLIRAAWSAPEGSSVAEVDWWQERKSFIGDLFAALQAKLQETPDQVNWVALARAIFRVLDQRHLQAWLADPTDTASEMLSEQGWDGAIRQATSDYLMVVDANMGFNKANAVVQEGLDYRVLVSADETAQATLTAQHLHLSSKDDGKCDPWAPYVADYDELINRCYWSYLRVYAPAGSQLVAVTPHPVSANLLVTGQRQSGSGQVLPEESGKAVFASFFVLPTGKETETRFVYQLPQGTLELTDTGWRYQLLVQKQAGTSAIPLRVTLTLPPGSEVQSVALPGWAHDRPTVQRPEPTTLVFETTLERDRFFEVLFKMADHDREETP